MTKVEQSRIGMKDLVVAFLEEDLESGALYGDVEKLAPAIQATITPSQEIQTQYADDKAVYVATQIGDTAVTIGATAIPYKMKAKLAGFKNIKGVTVYNQNAIPPFVAIGFKGTKADGNERYVWLLKGKFTLSADEYNTKAGSINLQTASLTGTFISRDYDNNFKVTGDTDDEDFGVYKEDFFKDVFDPAVLESTTP